MKRSLFSFILTAILVSTSGCALVVNKNPTGLQGTAPANPAVQSTPALAMLPPLPPDSPAVLWPTSTPSATPVATDTPTPSPTVVPPTRSPNSTPITNASLANSGDQSEATPELRAGPHRAALQPGRTPTVVVMTTAVLTPTLIPSPTRPPVLTPTPVLMPTPVPPTATAPAPTPTMAMQVALQQSSGLDQSPPTVRETTISINTFDYLPALVPTAPDDPVYPYSRLNHDRVGAPVPRDYRAVILENRYMQLTILPDLGGRLYRWIDKTSGQNLFYQNPVIKPTAWGNRGWWLATGGMEWALPLDEHGLSEASPWSYQLHQGDGLAGVTLSDTEERSGLISEITLLLDGTHAYFTLVPRIVNPTQAAVPYKFWLNGMFALGSPQPKAGLEFILPGSQVTVHSTGDTSLPGAGQSMSWPVYGGRDLSDYGTWTNYLGFFAAPAASAGYMGAYNHTTNLGVARVFPHSVAPGAKIFGPAGLDPSLWTTDGSGYVELWGGVAPTFADQKSLEPGQWITWQEYWYAVNNTDGFKLANQDAALNLKANGSTLQLAAVSTSPLDGQVVLQHNGSDVARWPVTLTPGMPFRADFSANQVANGGNWDMILSDPTGRIVARTGQSSPPPQQAASGAQVAAFYQPAPATPAPPPPAPAPTLPPPTPTPTPPVPTPILPYILAPTTTPTPIPSPTATGAPATSTAPEGVIWDPRLDTLEIKLTQAKAEPGQPVYRLVAARYQDEIESNGLHHVFVEVVDENGRRIVGQPVTLAWNDGQSTMTTEDKPAPEYAANAPLYGYLPGSQYNVSVAGAPSDTVNGLGLPGKHHVSYLLVFQRKKG